MPRPAEHALLVLARPVWDAVAAAVARAAPNEACGLLRGRRHGGLARACRLVEAANVAVDPVRAFEVDPAVLAHAQRADRHALGDGPRTLGVFHSHPAGDPVPSAADRRGMARQPGWLWLIVARDGRAAAWRWTAAGEILLPLVVEPAAPR